MRQQAGIGTLAYPFYVGQSSDLKPQPSEPDATLFETDTRRTFVWKDREWFPFTPSGNEAVVLAVNTAALSELRKIRRGIEMFMNQQLPDPGE